MPASLSPFCERDMSVETTKEFICWEGLLRHNSICTFKDKYPSLGKNTWQERVIIYRKMYFKQMAQQTQLDIKMEIEFLNFYQWAYQKLTHQKIYTLHFFVEQLILIHKLGLSYNSAQLNKRASSSFIVPYSLSRVYLKWVFLFFLKVIIRVKQQQKVWFIKQTS